MTNKKDDDLPTSVLRVDAFTGRSAAQVPAAAPPSPAVRDGHTARAQWQGASPPQPANPTYQGPPPSHSSGDAPQYPAGPGGWAPSGPSTGNQGGWSAPPAPAPQHVAQQPQGQGGYPPQGQGGYPPQGQGGYPPQGQGGYPPQGQGGYPPQGQGGYPPQGQVGYPAQGPGGYPPQPQPGYPPQPQPGYPPQPPPQAQPQPQSGYAAPEPQRVVPRAAPLVAELDWAPGMMIAGRYRLERSLGSGGAGLVVVAEDVLLRRKVAVKALRPNVARDPENVERFRKEVAICHGITHPNIVRTYDLGVDGGINYFSMEYIEGRPLSDLLEERGKLKPAEVRELAVRILRALEVAHHAKVVHRDLKPANIMLVEDERKCIVMDFGISGLVDEAAPRPEAPKEKDSGPVLQRMAAGGAQAAARFDVTSAGFGTPKFMSPEQWLGRQVGPASDLYTMGCILFQLLTGRAPFEATEDVVYASLHIGETPPRLRDVDPSLPRDFDSAIARCLEKDPEKRFQSAAQLAEAIAPRKTGRAVVRFAVRAIGLALALALLGLGLVTFAHRAIVREMKPAVQRLAELVALRLPATTAELDALDSAEDVSDPAFVRVRDYFDEVVRENPEVTYLYVMRGVPGTTCDGRACPLVYAVDKDAGVDANGDGTVDEDELGDHPGAEYDASHLPALIRALNEGVPGADDGFAWEPGYGLLLSGYALVGETRGPGGYVVGADLTNAPLVLFDRLVIGLCVLTWLLLLFIPPLIRKVRGKRALASGDTAAYSTV